jgi:hypothetical protein
MQTQSFRGFRQIWCSKLAFCRIVRYLNEKNIKITEFPISANEFADLFVDSSAVNSRALTQKGIVKCCFRGQSFGANTRNRKCINGFEPK